MDMFRPPIQVGSVNAFTCQHFQQLFKDGNKSGTVTTTSNGRIYNVTWETATNTISVKRDMTHVSNWNLFSETLSRWAKFNFTSHAEQWQRRLMLQKYNLEITRPLIPEVDALLKQIDDAGTRVAPPRHRSKSVQDDFNKRSVPLLQLLEKTKQDLARQARQLLSAVTTDLPANQRWVRQRETRGAIDNLQEQVRQFCKMMVNSQNTLALYALALGAVDVSKSTTIYDALLTRYSVVMTKTELFIQNYFDPRVSLPEAEVTGYNRMIRSETAVTEAFISQQVATHFTYNDLLLPPCYADSPGKEAQKQDQIRFNYQPHIMALTNVLIDPAKTLSDIQLAAQELKVRRDRWQEQLQLEEKTGNLLHRLYEEEKMKTSHPVFVKHIRQLEKLQKNIHNDAELLSPEDVELLQSQYKNIGRADALHTEVGQFLDDLPGFITFWNVSSYNDEMQSRILHLSVLRKMCQEEVSLTDHALDHMEHFATVHKNVLRQWINGDAFSRLKFYEPISSHLSYPVWLVDEHRLFQQKAQGIKETLWETRYQILRNEELMKTRELLLEKNVEKTEILLESSVELKDAAQRLRNKINSQ